MQFTTASVVGALVTLATVVTAAPTTAPCPPDFRSFEVSQVIQQVVVNEYSKWNITAHRQNKPGETVNAPFKCEATLDWKKPQLPVHGTCDDGTPLWWTPDGYDLTDAQELTRWGVVFIEDWCGTNTLTHKFATKWLDTELGTPAKELQVIGGAHFERLTWTFEGTVEATEKQYMANEGEGLDPPTKPPGRKA